MSKEIISNIKELGTPVTTGELIEILSKYPKKYILWIQKSTASNTL